MNVDSFPNFILYSIQVSLKTGTDCVLCTSVFGFGIHIYVCNMGRCLRCGSQKACLSRHYAYSLYVHIRVKHASKVNPHQIAPSRDKRLFMCDRPALPLDEPPTRLRPSVRAPSVQFSRPFSLSLSHTLMLKRLSFLCSRSYVCLCMRACQAVSRAFARVHELLDSGRA